MWQTPRVTLETSTRYMQVKSACNFFKQNSIPFKVSFDYIVRHKKWPFNANKGVHDEPGYNVTIHKY